MAIRKKHKKKKVSQASVERFPLAPESVLQAIEDPETADYAPDKQLIIGVEGRALNLSESLETFSVSMSADSGAIQLDASLSGRLPRTLVNAPVYLVWYVNNYPIPMLTGTADRPVLAGHGTQLLASSPAGGLEGAKLLAPLAHEGTPAHLVRKALKISGEYNMGQVRVEDLGPRIRATDSEGFEEDNSVRDVLSSVQEETDCVYRDTPLLGFDGFLPPAGAVSEAVWTYEVQEGLSWVPDSDIEDLFSEVVVLKKAQPDADPPVDGWRVRAPVTYQSMPYPPKKNRVDYVVVSDSAEEELARADAKRMARQRARKHSRQQIAFTFSGPFNPLLKLYSVIRIGEDVLDLDRKRWRTEWLCVLDGSITHTWAPGELTTELQGSGMVLSETFVPEAPTEIGRRTTKTLEIDKAPTGPVLVPSDDLVPSNTLVPLG